ARIHALRVSGHASRPGRVPRRNREPHLPRRRGTYEQRRGLGHLFLTKEGMPSRFPPGYSDSTGLGIRARAGNGIMACTIQRRLTLILTVTCALLGTAGGSGLYFAVRSGLLSSFDGMLKARAEGLAALIKEPKQRKSNEDSPRPALPDFTGIK